MRQPLIHHLFRKGVIDVLLARPKLTEVQFEARSLWRFEGRLGLDQRSVEGPSYVLVVPILLLVVSIAAAPVLAAFGLQVFDLAGANPAGAVLDVVRILLIDEMVVGLDEAAELVALDGPLHAEGVG